MARLRTTTATSAGGVVVRHEAGQPYLVVGCRRRERDGRTWTLPKGPLDSIEYFFVQSGTRIHKTVHYFMMEPTGGDLADHDHEFEQVKWIPFADAPSVLTFETERALVSRAAELVAGDAEGVAGDAT